MRDQQQNYPPCSALEPLSQRGSRSLGCSIDDTEKTPQDRCRQGHVARAAGDLEQARDLYLQAVRDRPDYLTAWKSLAELYVSRFDFVRADAAAQTISSIVPVERREEIFGKLERVFHRSVCRLPGADLCTLVKPIIGQAGKRYFDQLVSDAHVVSCQDNCEGLGWEARDLLICNSQSREYDSGKMNRSPCVLEKEIRKIIILLLAGRFEPSLRRLSTDLRVFCESLWGKATNSQSESRLKLYAEAMISLDKALRSETLPTESERIQTFEVCKRLFAVDDIGGGFDFLSIVALRTVASALPSSALTTHVQTLSWGDCLMAPPGEAKGGMVVRLVEQLCASSKPDQAERLISSDRGKSVSLLYGPRLARALRTVERSEVLVRFLDSKDCCPSDARRALATSYQTIGRPREALRIWEELRGENSASERYDLKCYLSCMQLAYGPKAAEKAFFEDFRSKCDSSRDGIQSSIEALRCVRTVPAIEAVAKRFLESDHKEDAGLLRVLASFSADLGADVRTVSKLADAWYASEPDEESAALLHRAREAIQLFGDRLSGYAGNLSISAIGIDVLLRASADRSLAAGDGPVALVMPSMGPGGIQRQVFNTVRGLIADYGGKLAPMVVPVSMADRNFDFYLDRFREIGAGIAPAVPDEHTPVLAGVPNRDLVLKGLSLLPERSARTIAYFADLFIAERPRLVHGWYDTVNVWAGIGARIAGVPRIVLGARSIAPRGRRREIVEATPAYRGLLAFDNVEIATLSENSADDFKQWLDLPNDKVRVIYLGVDESQFDLPTLDERMAAVRAELPVRRGARIVGSAFRFSHEKRPFLWLDSAAEVLRRREDVHFVLLGDGRLNEEMRHHAKLLGISDRVVFAGLTQDVAAYVGQFDALLMTSDFEGTSNVVPEAQTLGVPVVATRVGGLPEAFIDGQTGFGVSPDASPAEIAETIDRALDPLWSAKARPLARQYARARFGTERMVRETAEVYGWSE